MPVLRLMLPPALALKIPVLVKPPPVILMLPVSQLTVPVFVQFRDEPSTPAELMVLIPAVVNRPVPFIVPAVQLKPPLTTTSPVPPSVPPDTFTVNPTGSAVAVLKLSVPPPMVNAPVVLVTLKPVLMLRTPPVSAIVPSPMVQVPDSVPTLLPRDNVVAEAMVIVPLLLKLPPPEVLVSLLTLKAA